MTKCGTRNTVLITNYTLIYTDGWLDRAKTISNSLRIAQGILVTLAIQSERIEAALDAFMLATDLADYLVRKDVPFRETHHISRRCVAELEQINVLKVMLA